MLKIHVLKISTHVNLYLPNTAFVPQSKAELKKAVIRCTEAEDCLDAMVAEWDVSRVTDMSALVFRAGSFNADIAKWDVSRVIYMDHMFSEATSFNADISKWKVSRVVDMRGMFKGAISFTSDISKWDVSHVTNMRSMFAGAISFNADISKWNVSQVIGMRGMFHAAISFNVQISSWNVSRVASMQGMFLAAVSFNQTLCGASWVKSKANQHQIFAGSAGSISPLACPESTTTSPVTCRKCGIDKYGYPSCCGFGGAWFKNCGDAGDSKFDHTWSEGIQACKGKRKNAQTNCIHIITLDQIYCFSNSNTHVSAPTITKHSAAMCPTCGSDFFGNPSCCAPGGTWFHNCGWPGDSRFDHTWYEGVQACESKCSTRYCLDNARSRTPYCLHILHDVCDHVSASAERLVLDAKIDSAKCPRCVAKKSGKLSCCTPGGAWFKNCGDPGDPNFDHTWGEGIQACKNFITGKQIF